MPSWSDFHTKLSVTDVEKRGDFINNAIKEFTRKIADRSDRNVLFYASSFLQKPQIGGLYTSINSEDINGFMAGVKGHDFDRGLLLLLHTPGGMAEAAQTIVDYLRSKYQSIDVLVPTYAMSAGTMIALGCDKILMGRQSQLGPTDPQLIIGNMAFSAHSIVDQFEEAKQEIAANTALAHAWAPVLRSFGPALLQEARKSIAYGQSLVKDWLQRYMFSELPEATERATNAANYFGGNRHGSHGRRIDRDEARVQHLDVVDLENDQELQDHVLSLYHLLTITFEQTPAVKIVVSSNGGLWVKNMQLEASGS